MSTITTSTTTTTERMTPLRIQLLAAGYCKQIEALTLRGGRWRTIRFPAIFACIEHPRHGLVLVDTGYAERFRAATRAFPYRLYRWVTPVAFRAEEGAAEQLRRRGYSAADVRYVIATHFHADHVAGLRDFPQARIVCSAAAYAAVRSLRGVAAVKRAFLPALLPADAEERLLPLAPDSRVLLPPELAPFADGYDVFGDGSITAIDLPGHAAGQIGVALTDSRGQRWLLGADAAWSMRAVRERRLPHPAAFALFDAPAYRETFSKLAELHRRQPDLRIAFSHCPEAWALCGMPENRSDADE